MKRTAFKPVEFETVSQWQEAGGIEAGFYALEKVREERERAIGFVAEKFSETGALRPATCWIPKTLLMRVKNDFYQHGPQFMYLVPAWVYSSRVDEGFFL